MKSGKRKIKAKTGLNEKSAREELVGGSGRVGATRLKRR
jgi:hypothetical protein